MEPEEVNPLLDYFKKKFEPVSAIASEVFQEYHRAPQGGAVRQRYIEVLIDLMKWVEDS